MMSYGISRKLYWARLANSPVQPWQAPFHNVAFDNISQHLEEFRKKLVTNISVNIRAFAVAGGCEVETQIPVLQTPLDHRNIPLAAIKKDKGVDVPGKKIRSLNVVRLVKGILHQGGVIRTAAFRRSRQFHFPGKHRRLAAFAKMRRSERLLFPVPYCSILAWVNGQSGCAEKIASAQDLTSAQKATSFSRTSCNWLMRLGGNFVFAARHGENLQKISGAAIQKTKKTAFVAGGRCEFSNCFLILGVDRPYA